MGTKVVVVLGLFLAVALLLSSEVASAGELAETAAEETQPTEVTDQGGYGGGYGGGRGGYGGGGYGGGRGGYGGRRGGYCRYGCCGRRYNGCRCCSFAGEKPDVEVQN